MGPPSKMGSLQDGQKAVSLMTAAEQRGQLVSVAPALRAATWKEAALSALEAGRK